MTGVSPGYPPDPTKDHTGFSNRAPVATTLRKRRRLWPWFLAVVTMTTSGVMYWLVNDSGDDLNDRLAFRTATISHRSLGDTIVSAGKLRPRKVVEVGAQVSGQLSRLHVKVGDTVSRGDLLAEMDATIQSNLVLASRASLKAKESQLTGLRAVLAQAEARVRRQRRLMAANDITVEEFERAENDLVIARSTMEAQSSLLESQRASLTSEEAKLGFSRIYAPMDGTVLQLVATEGQTLTANYATPIILHLADLVGMTVEAKVAEANIGKLERGMDVYFTTLGGGDRRWHSRLTQILPQASVDSDVVTYTALFDVDNVDRVLLPGMSAHVFFEVSPRRFLAAPLDMVSDFRTDEDGRVTGEVGILRGDDRVEAKRISIGEITHNYAEVLSGLAEGDRIVANRSQMPTSNAARE